MSTTEQVVMDGVDVTRNGRLSKKPSPLATINIATINAALSAAMQALAERAMRWATLLLAFFLYYLVSWQPGPWTLAAAVAFTLLVLPLWWRRDGV